MLQAENLEDYLISTEGRGKGGEIGDGSYTHQNEWRSMEARRSLLKTGAASP